MKFSYLLRIAIGLAIWMLGITGIFWIYSNDVESKIPAVKDFIDYYNAHYNVSVLYDYKITANIGDPIYFNDPLEGLIKIGEVELPVKKQIYYYHFEIGEVVLIEREDLKYWMQKISQTSKFSRIKLKKLDLAGENAEIFYDTNAKTAYVQKISTINKYNIREKWMVTFWINSYKRNYVSEDLKFKYCNSPNDIGAVLSTLFDENTKARIMKKISNFRDKYEEKFADLLVPFLKNRLSDYYSLIEDDISTAFENHQDDFQEMFETLYEGKIQEEMLPLVEDKTIPLFHEKLKPELMKLGSELWESLPMWSLGWKWVTGSNEDVMKRFDEWLVKDGYPIINNHRDELIESVEKIINDLVYDADIAEKFQEILQDFLSNPKLADTLMQMAKEIIIDNPETAEFFKKLWESDEMQNNLETVGSWLEPLLVSLSDDIMLDLSNPGEQKINPNLVKVLRSQILWKDDVWWVVTSTKSGEFLPVKSGYIFK